MRSIDGVRFVDGDDEAGVGLDKSEILVVRRTKSDPWALCFGGLRHGFGMPPFEFVNFLRARQVNVMFIRDSRQAWYQRGLEGLAVGLSGTTQFLQGLLRELQAPGVVTVGNSAGGFAAIYFGRTLGARRAVAFAPQTFLDPFRRVRNHETRWKTQTRSLYRYCGLWRSSFRLETVLETCAAQGDTHVHYPSTHRPDARHVAYLRGVPHVVLHPHDLDGHDMVRTLRDDGTLDAVFTEALSD